MCLAIQDDAPSLKKKLFPCNVDIWQLLDFLLILWCSQIGNDPWECLAKFGYELNMKKSLKIILVLFQLPTGNMYRNLVILEF
jgi:hypothetical protein